MAGADRPQFGACPAAEGACGFDIAGTSPGAMRPVCIFGQLCEAPGAEDMDIYMGNEPRTDGDEGGVELTEAIAYTAAHDREFAAGSRATWLSLQEGRQ